MTRFPRRKLLVLALGLGALSTHVLAQGVSGEAGNPGDIPRGRAVVPPPKPPVETLVVPGVPDKVKAPKGGKRMDARMKARAKDAKEKAEKAEKSGL